MQTANGKRQESGGRRAAGEKTLAIVPPSVRRAWLAAVCLLPLTLCSSARAQTIEMLDGTSVKPQSLRREGDTVLATIQTKDGGAGEVGYPIGNITRITFPEPALLKTAPDLIAKGPSEDALKQLAQAVAYYQPFLEIPGSYWKPLVRLQIDALTKAHRDRELDAIAATLARSAGTDPDLARLVKFRQAAIYLRQNSPQKVLDLLNPVVRDENATANDLAEGWLYLGAAHLAKREYKPALLAYLHLPMYTPDRIGLMPTALLGIARSYVGIDDKVRAKDALDNIVANYPTTPEATEAKDQLAKIAARASKPAGG